jgi:two-component system chemotaxis response regulator CheB
MSKKIRVLIIDHSAVVRQEMSRILSSDPHIKVIGVAADTLIAAERLKKEIPDVITLDVEMPRKEGITFLKKIMSRHPVPVLICSSMIGQGSESALKALEYGAVDIIQKPLLGVKTFLEESRVLICDAVKAAARAQVKRIAPESIKVAPKLTADVMLAKPVSRVILKTTEKVVVVGASTGGTEALRIFLEALPHDAPGVVIVQHMPEHFTKSFAARLDSLCRITVKEAENNDTVSRGLALIAPGNRHLLLKRNGAGYNVEIKDGPLVCRHRPSVDVLFRSTARYAGKNAVGIILTGMGDDGARGLLEMKEAGASTIAQDENSCVVFGMPKEAIKQGAVDLILPLENIADAVAKIVSLTE